MRTSIGIERTGHSVRTSDVDRLAALGVRAFRQPVLWERTAPEGLQRADWRWADERLGRLRALGVRPIVGLVHHGSGPTSTSLLDPAFARGLAQFARAVAERYPWVEDWTPVNEPLTTARFSALYGHWYPHERSARAFVRALLVQCGAIGASMRAIREISPRARLVQTEDIGMVFATPRVAYQARFENVRRYLSLDLLAGRVDRRHPLWGWLVGDCGASEAELDAFVAQPCPPDLIGINYYVTSDRFLDERVDRYPASTHGGNGREAYADVEAVRVRARGIAGHLALLRAVGARYGRPVAITEAHLGGAPEEQIRWLAEAWSAALDAQAEGVDVRAVTAWSAFGAYDWDSLLVRPRGHYEAGLFDVRGRTPRPTALATVARELGGGGRGGHPLLEGEGWWRRSCRLSYPPSGPAAPPRPVRAAAPLLVVGAAGTLGSAVVRVCRQRGIDVVALSRESLDVTDADAIARVLGAVRPWAVVNAAGYVRVDDAEYYRERCWRANTFASELVASACGAQSVRYAAFSSDLVFDGKARQPYVERDDVAPLSVYGASKAEAERRVLAAHPDAIVVRTSCFFGPWDQHNFVARALESLERRRVFRAPEDAIVSPTFVPDLCNAVLTLLVDGASGVWHLANRGAVSWYELAREAARRARVDAAELAPCATADLRLAARRPLFSALASERGALMPSLEDALARHVAMMRVRA